MFPLFQKKRKKIPSDWDSTKSLLRPSVLCPQILGSSFFIYLTSLRLFYFVFARRLMLSRKSTCLENRNRLVNRSHNFFAILTHPSPYSEKALFIPSYKLLRHRDRKYFWNSKYKWLAVRSTTPKVRVLVRPTSLHILEKLLDSSEYRFITHRLHSANNGESFSEGVFTLCYKYTRRAWHFVPAMLTHRQSGPGVSALKNEADVQGTK